MKSLIISPWSRKTPKGEHCAKNYPFWPELLMLFKKENIKLIQIGVLGEQVFENLIDEIYLNKKQEELLELLKLHKNWLSVDNFFPHFAHFYGFYGSVIFSKSDPNIFGYKENNNIIKNRSFLRKSQFLFWDNEKIDNNSFASPKEVFKSVIKIAR